MTLLAAGPREVALAARPAGARDGGLRRRHDRHHPWLLPGGARGLGTAGDLERETRVVEDSPTWSRRSSTISTSGATTAARVTFDRAEALRSRGPRWTTRGAHRAARRPDDEHGRRCGTGWPWPRARSSSGASAAWRHDLRRSAHPAGRRARRPGWRCGAAPACAPAIASCSSTSSRTQTRSSGTSSVARSASGDVDARPHRRSQAGDLRVPRRRRVRVPRPPRGRATRATLRRTGAATRLIDAYDALFDGAKLGHAGIVVPPGQRGRRAPALTAARRAGDAALRVRVVRPRRAAVS